MLEVNVFVQLCTTYIELGHVNCMNDQFITMARGFETATPLWLKKKNIEKRRT